MHGTIRSTWQAYSIGELAEAHGKTSDMKSLCTGPVLVLMHPLVESEPLQPIDSETHACIVFVGFKFIMPIFTVLRHCLKIQCFITAEIAEER